MPLSLIVVLDTNVWISGIFFKRGIPSQVLSAWSSGSFEVVFIPETLTELQTKLEQKVRQFKADPALAEEWLTYISTFGQLVSSPGSITGICRDPKDDKFLEAAVSANADYIVTGDKDLLSIKLFRGIEVVSPAEFLDRVGKNIYK
jgi:putative PIN family toxin of toxin-antitoxin system